MKGATQPPLPFPRVCVCVCVCVRTHIHLPSCLCHLSGIAHTTYHIQLYVGSVHLDPASNACVSSTVPTGHLPSKDSLLLLALIACLEVLQHLL